MVQKFPSTNLIALVLRQITQPLSKIIVKHVRKRPFVRKYILMQLGIFCYWCENKIKRRMISPPLTVTKRPLDDIRTMELGTRLLLEALVFTLLWGIIIYETSKAIERVQLVEQRKIQIFDDLKADKNRLTRQIEDQVILTKQLKDTVIEYSRQVGCTLPTDPDIGKENEQK